MACWTDFSHIIDQHLAEYDPAGLEIATVQAAIELGDAIGGFSDYMETQAAPFVRDTTCMVRPAYTIKVAVAPAHGFRLVGVTAVHMNDTIVPRTDVKHDYTCARYSVSDCGTVTIAPVASGITPTVRVDFTAVPEYGKVGSEMPDFLLSKYGIPMKWKILALLTKGRASEGFENNYLRAKRTYKNRIGTTRGIVGGRMV